MNHVEYLLIGGYAVGVYGYVRATNDLDVWVRMSPGNAANLERALKEFGFQSADAELFQIAGNIVRMGLPPIRIEILTTISGADFDTCFQERSLVEIETGLRISVSHLPPGTSKWNKIEHRLFSFISQNWRGKPLTSVQVMVSHIAATVTKTGPKVHSEVDSDTYPAGIKVSDRELAAVNLYTDKFHGDWNYQIRPRSEMVIS